MKKKAKYIVGIDTGGTFTDTVIVDQEGSTVMGKALTNYQDFKAGVMKSFENAVEKLDITAEEILKNTVFVGHGTTLGTNAVINREFGRAGLLTTMGHEDVTIIARAGARTDGLGEKEIRHQAVCRKPEPLIPKIRIKGVRERVDCFGEIIVEMNEKQASQAIDELLEDGVEAIAVCLLWSFNNPAHENRLKEMILEKNPDIYVATSNEVTPQIREYARSMTVVIDACIGKLMREYIDSLNREFMGRGLQYPISIMHAYGGVTSSATARPIATIESGPVGGVIGGKYLGEALGYDNVITTDVGGTSFDVSVLHGGEWTFRKEPIMMRFRVTIPIIDITCIGAAGGSIVRAETATGLLRVGPDSAGSNPGPVCYGSGGTEPTITDCDLILGYLNPGFFYEGKMKLDRDMALKAMEEKVAKPMKMDVVEAAAGAYDIVNFHMADNLRQSVVEKGYDPRDFVLLSYGGNGPMHVGSYAKELGAKKAFIPPQAPVFSAFGIATSDIVHIYRQTEMYRMPADPKAITASFQKMENKAIGEMKNEGFKPEDVILHRELEMRYARQVHEVPVTIPNGELTDKDIENIMIDWEKNYEMIFGKGSGFREAGIQVITFRLTAVCKIFKPAMKEEKFVGEDSSAAVKERRDVFFRANNKFVETPIYDFLKLKNGNTIVGPAIIEAPTTTIVVLPDQIVKSDPYRNIVFEKF